MRQMSSYRLVRGCLLAALTALLITLSAAALAESFPFTTVTNDQVNMRRNASSTSVVLERISAGTTVTVLGEKGNYYKISYKDRTGYVIKEYVSAPAAAATPTPALELTAPGYPYETTTRDSVNLRERQSTQSAKLASIPRGAVITVEQVSGSFAKVNYNGLTGYCVKDYLNLKTIVSPTATPEPVATVAPEANASGYQVLQKGSSGNAVTALQEALIELGFLSGNADGLFGAGTESAVIAFQEKNDYPATGIVDVNLQAFLYSGKPKNAKGVKTEVKTLAPVEGVTIRLNDRGAQVRTVQTRLKELGYYTGEITGEYNTATRDAVKAFQKKNGLTVDGVCGTNTQGCLLGAYALSATATATPVPTEAPTPAPTFQVPQGTVKQGSKGADATLVQQRLIDLGYLTGKADGQFGTDSVAALREFQRQNGLKDDGAAGTDTCRVLFSYDALAKGQLPTAAPTPAPTIPVSTPAPGTTYPPITQDNVVLIKLGVSDEAVTRLQQRLTALGYYDANADGVCKADDVAAIKAFQKQNGLKADGMAGYDTQSRMYSVTAVTASGAMAGGTVDTFTTLKKGMTGTEVAAMQQRLIDLGYLSGKADGNFGRDTFEAVYAFQKQNGLKRDGIAGSATLSLLYSSTVQATTPTPKPTATPAPTATPTVTLKKGDVSSAVRDMQARLIEMGYLSGSADGKFGVQTYRALLAFQKQNGLDADGIAGSKTLTLLNSANAVGAVGTAGPAATPAPGAGAGSTVKISADKVIYTNWYTSVRALAKKYPYATVYDFTTGLSWQVHMFSLGAHADSEPLTAADTAIMEKAFGGNTWTPKAVWVIFGDGSVYMASTHSYPHEVQHITDNNFPGHLCIHFPRTAAQVAAIGPYATKHQSTIDGGWATTQSMIR